MINKLKESVNFIKSKINEVPKVAVVLGSGLGAYADDLKCKTTIPYSEIPHMHATAVDGHQGKLVFGKTEDGTSIVALQGRIHAYEGHDMQDVVYATRMIGLLGVKNIVYTNAAGAINENYTPGDLVIIKDHLNLQNRNPLIGKNISELGPRFPDMTHAYCPEIIKIFESTCKEIGIKPIQGVYVGLLGPTYETPSEIKMLRILGGDMVGMSTVPEVIAANHMGLRVGAISCITNMGAGISKEKLNHEEVKEQGEKVKTSFSDLISKSLTKIASL